MSKIAEQKALEAYPKAPSPYYDDHILDKNVNCRAGYIKGYDQAFQYFMERAIRFLAKETVLADCKIEQFKNYMEK